MLLSALLATPCAHADEQQPNRPVTVERVEEDTTFRLTDGRHVKLDALEIPNSKQAMAALQAMVEGKVVTLSDAQPDRYGRLVASVWHDGVLVQQQLVASGEAIVLALRPGDVAKTLLATEAKARQKRLGLWGQAGWVIDHEQARKAMGTVKLVSGVVRAVAVKSGVGYINFGEDWKTDFSIHLPKKTMRQFGKKALEKLVGQKVLVRGMIHDYYGPRITLYEPSMLEIYAD